MHAFFRCEVPRVRKSIMCIWGMVSVQLGQQHDNGLLGSRVCMPTASLCKSPWARDVNCKAAAASMMLLLPKQTAICHKAFDACMLRRGSCMCCQAALCFSFILGRGHQVYDSKCSKERKCGDVSTGQAAHS